MANAPVLVINTSNGLMAYAAADDDIPDGYIKADGSTIDGTSETYAQLGSLIGTRYGGISRAALTLPSGIPSSLISGGVPGTELDYAQITSSPAGITATTEGTAVTIITGNSVTYDGSKVRVEFMIPDATYSATTVIPTFVLFRDTTPLGQINGPASASSASRAGFSWAMLDTPPAGAHVYKLGVFQANGTYTVVCGAGGTGAKAAAYLRTTRA